MAKAPANMKQAAEQEKMAWALTKADLQALVLRANAIIAVGSETNLSIVNQVVQDMKTTAATIAKNIAEWSKPIIETPESGQ